MTHVYDDPGASTLFSTLRSGKEEWGRAALIPQIAFSHLIKVVEMAPHGMQTPKSAVVNQLGNGYGRLAPELFAVPRVVRPKRYVVFAAFLGWFSCLSRAS